MLPPLPFPALQALPLAPAFQAQAALLKMAAQPLYWPFDQLRLQYDAAVNAGLVERSLIAAGRFEQWAAALESVTLGPFARTV